METKVCSNCKETKPICDFYSKGNGYFKSRCKICDNLFRVERAKKSRELFRESLPSHKECSNCKCVKPIDEFYFNSKSKTIQELCISCFNDKTISKTHNTGKNEEYRIKINRKETERRKSKSETNEEYRIKINKKRTERRKRKCKSDPIYKFKQNLRKSIRRVFKNLGVNKPCNTVEITGIDFDGLIKHFEGLFQDGMTWENKNWWHVDHIVPISVAQTIDEAKYLNHYTNLRPIWSSDNIKKSNTIDETNIEKYNEFLKKMRNN